MAYQIFPEIADLFKQRLAKRTERHSVYEPISLTDPVRRVSYANRMLRHQRDGTSHQRVGSGPCDPPPANIVGANPFELLEAGANPNTQLKRRPPYRDVPQDRGGDTILAQGATPLLRAARAGDAKFAELLLKHGALVDLPSKEGVTPLMAAAGVEFGTRVTRGRNRTNEGVLATMQVLIDAGADINAHMVAEPRRVVTDGAAARAAAGAGRGGRASQVPSALAVPHSTALHGAAEHGYTPFVKFLAEHGADLAAKDADGRTALDLARGVGRAGIRGPAPEAYPETAALLESLMKAKGIPLPAPAGK